MRTSPPEQIRKRTICIFVIFNKQNSHALALRRSWRRNRGNLCFRFLARGENQRKRRAFMSSGTFRSDRALVRFHQGLADGESQAQASGLSPTALFERIENFRQQFLLNSHPSVCDLHTELSA